MRQRTRNLLLGAIAICCLASYACAAHREVALGMTSEEVLGLLGKPDSRTRTTKRAPTIEYFGPKASAEYLALPEGAAIEVWSYHRFRESWSYVFDLREQPARLVDQSYYHPSIKY